MHMACTLLLSMAYLAMKNQIPLYVRTVVPRLLFGDAELKTKRAVPNQFAAGGKNWIQLV